MKYSPQVMAQVREYCDRLTASIKEKYPQSKISCDINPTHAGFEVSFVVPIDGKRILSGLLLKLEAIAPILDSKVQQTAQQIIQQIEQVRKQNG